VRGPLKYYHWCCSHSAAGIRETGTVRPHLGLSWWTDIDTPGRRSRAALGLTSQIIACDRMEYRCEAEPWSGHGPLAAWSDYARDRLDAGFIAELESAPGVDPGRWYVAWEPVPVRSVRRVRW
jgi:hypothetical protein